MTDRIAVVIGGGPVRAANRAILVTPRTTRMIWRLNRLAPGLVLRQATRFVDGQRRPG